MNKLQIIILVLCAFGVVNLSSKANVLQNTLNNARVNKAIYRNQMFLKPNVSPLEHTCPDCDSTTVAYKTTCPPGKTTCTPVGCPC
jgi:hypothetical protein